MTNPSDAAEAEERNAGPKKERPNVPFPPKVVRYVEQLRDGGLYGGSVPEVIRSLVEMGLRTAHRRGHLKL